MASLISLSTALTVSLLFALAHAWETPGLSIPGLTAFRGETTGQEQPRPVAPTSCKCGGQYANGRVVTGCVNDQCSLNGTDTRCVKIRLSDHTIGYDCLPWPADVADCSTFDDGSMVCADAACSPDLQGEESNSNCVLDSDSRQVTVATSLTTKGFDFIMDAIKYQVGVFVGNLTIPDIVQMIPIPAVGEVNLTIVGLKIDEFIAPTMSYQLLPPSSIKIMANGGHFKVTAKWSVYKAYMANMGGDVLVTAKSEKGVDVSVTITITVNEKGQLRLDTSDCKVDVPPYIHFTGSTVGWVVNGLGLAVEALVENRINAFVCPMIKEAATNTIPGILDALPTQYTLYDPLGMSYTFRIVTVTDDAVIAQLAANGTFVVNAANATTTNGTLTEDPASAVVAQPVANAVDPANGAVPVADGAPVASTAEAQ